MTELEGKVALVTGGSRGIGAAIALRLAADGADIAITYARAADHARTVTENIRKGGRRALAIQADTGDDAQATGAVERAVAELGRIDILVNNAGIFQAGPVEEVTPEQIDRMLAVHVRGVFLASQAALRHMGQGGRIVSIGSCLAQRVPHPGVTLYAMSKSALIGFTKGLARDVGSRGITVNVVDPGPTDTDMNPADAADAEGQRGFIALGSFADPDDIAATVAHLASRRARFITGTSIAVDGGQNA